MTNALERPLKIDSFVDGAAYRLPPAEFVQHNLFLRVAVVDDVIIKLPSQRGWGDYLKFVKNGERDPDEIRPNEDLEEYSKCDRLASRFPEFATSSATFKAEHVHYLLVSRFQHERLMGQQSFAIPASRFVMAVEVDSTEPQPAIVQQRVDGVSLSDMVDGHGEVKSQFRPGLSSISRKIESVLGSRWLPWRRGPLRNHIDWNIENLIFDAETETLFYIGSLPSTFFNRSHNKINIRGIRTTFIRHR